MRSNSTSRRSKNRSTFQYQALEPRKLLAGDVIISEFVASNNGSLLDVYEESPDWIELHNRGDAAVDLQGYHLTDDPANPIGWTFNSSLVIAPGEYKIVFASSRNEVDVAGSFHTDFRLSAGGEYLALYDANLNLKSEYGVGGTNYPPQLTDVSYGIEQGALLNGSSVAQYLIPTDNSFETTWFNNNFDSQAAGFSDGRAAIGYENSPGSNTSYVDEYLTEVPSGTTSVYLRNEFHLDDASAVTDLVGSFKYDDGFGVWLNGQFLFSENASNGFAWNATASGIHNDADALQYQSYALDGSTGSVGNFLNLLVDGQNTLAIHALNESSTSSDFLMSPQLITSSISGDVSYLETPTPGQPNSGLAVLGPQIDGVTSTATIEPGQSITVTAAVSQFDLPVDASSVRLHYRVMFGNEITVTMNDSGTGADAVAGDGIFSATLNSSAVPAGQMVRWYVTASDSSGTSSRAPRFFDPLDSAEYFGAVVTDTSITTDLALIQWFIEDTDAANTDFGTRSSIFLNGQFYDNVQVDIHGQSTRGSAFLKKSYDFDANSGEKFDIPGIGKQSDFNLLTNYADQSKVRHSFAYEALAAAGIASLSGQATTVYRNGDFYALYDLVEEGDEEYLDRVGLDPDGALYKVNNRLDHAYNNVSKKTRNFEDHSDFQEVVNGAALTGNAATTWQFDRIDIAGMINYLAGETVQSNTDFGHKNMYWYRDTEGTGLWTPLPWDQDLSFGHKWTASVNPPYFDNTLYTNGTLRSGFNDLFQHVYNTPELREMYYRRLKTLTDQMLGTPGTSVTDSFVYQRLAEIQTQLSDEIAADIAEWGIHPNFSAAYPFNPTEAIEQIQDVFISERRDFINNDSNVPDAQVGIPTIEFDDIDFDSSPISGLQDEEYVRLNNPGSEAVDISGWTLNGGISHTFKSGTVIPAGSALYVVADVVAFQNRTTGAGSGQQLFIQGNYSGNISNLGEVIELRAQDGTFVDDFTAPSNGLTPNQEFLRISEINYHPADSVADAEYIEFLNTGTETLDLAGVSVTEGPSLPFVFPNATMLAAGERVLIVQDPVAFANAYPGVPASQVVGTYTGKLSNAGENVRLEEPGGEKILEVSYGDNDPWYFGTDGGGQSLQLVDEFGTSLLTVDKYYSWRASSALNGTPGQPPVAASGVVINEVLAHTDDPLVDSIELFNPTSQPILIGDLYLSDSVADLQKYQIPSGTVLAAGEYVVFDESHFNPTPTMPGPKDFSLSSTGDQVYLTRLSNGETSFEDAVEFGATVNGESLGRLPDGSGRLTRMLGLTFGAVNDVHAQSPLVITEFNYNPPPPSAEALAADSTITDNDLEFIEIHNASGDTIDLSQWRLRGEVDYDFAAGTTLDAQGTVVVVPFDPTDVALSARLDGFRAQYNIGADIVLVGGYQASLSNSYGRVSLQRVEDVVLGAYATLDEVVYDDLAPFEDADNNGLTLQRGLPSSYGNAAASWFAEAPTPGVYGVCIVPELSDVVVNLGGTNRSDVNQLTISFTGVVDFGPDAFSVVQRSDMSGPTGTVVDTSFTSQVVGGNTEVTLVFESLTRSSAGSLLDGNYQLTVNASSVTDSTSGLPMAEDYVFGDTEDESFYAFFGDADGNRTVNVVDLLPFRRTYRANAGDANFDQSFDYDNNGTINVLDLLRFRQRYRETLEFS